MSYDEHLISLAGGDGEPDRPDLVATGPTRCAASQAPMTWDGSRWVHAPGLCADPGHEIDLDAIQARVDAARARRQQFEAASRRFSEGHGADGSMSRIIDATKNDVPGLIEDNEALLAVVRSQQAQIERVEALCTEWDAVVDVFPLTPAALFAGSHAKRVRAALTATEGAA